MRPHNALPLHSFSHLLLANVNEALPVLLLQQLVLYLAVVVDAAPVPLNLKAWAMNVKLLVV